MNKYGNKTENKNRYLQYKHARSLTRHVVFQYGHERVCTGRYEENETRGRDESAQRVGREQHAMATHLPVHEIISFIHTHTPRQDMN